MRRGKRTRAGHTGTGLSKAVERKTPTREDHKMTGNAHTHESTSRQATIDNAPDHALMIEHDTYPKPSTRVVHGTGYQKVRQKKGGRKRNVVKKESKRKEETR